MAKPKGRAHLFKNDEDIVKDYDPEFNGPEKDHVGSDSEASADEGAGTEHYVAVGESKMRGKAAPTLGTKYRGSRVSRAALEQSDDEEEDDEDEDEDEDGTDYADPELADLEADEAKAADSEIESDDALAESDTERFKDFAFRGSSKPAKKLNKRATAADFMSSDEDEDEGAQLQDEDDEDEEEYDSEEDEDMDDGLDDLINGGASSEEDVDDASEDEEDEEDASEEDDDSDDEESEKKTKQESAKPMLGALSNTADIEKGMAIRKQRQAYDGLLNLRIRLQKALIAANTFTAIDDALDMESEPYEAAEEAAIKLLNTISSLRDGFGPAARVGEKRKRSLEVSMPSEEIWQQLQEEDRGLIKFREDRLEKWSKKVQSVTVTAAKGLGGNKNKSLLNALQDQLTDPDNRLVKRSKVPRSCAPAQAAKKVTEDENIYDDADFYQLLLKELVEQRTVEGSADQSSAVPTVMLTAAKEAKTRKQVDRKASKGRKMRFTVHEKLQNFMAPEDRRTWEQDQISRLFGTLFGQKLELNEESEDEEMSDDDVNAEEEGLRLFRN